VFKKLLILPVLFFLTGCATTRPSSQTAQLQMRVNELERQVEDKDEEIKNLNYQLKDMAYESDKGRSRKTQVESVANEDSGQIIRVGVSADKVQLALKNAGYYQGPVDGKVGSKTKKAISAFQKDNNLKADGVIGKQTWMALKTHLDK
jgi:murein L,D-transpeptidase YcbB/YkuD